MEAFEIVVKNLVFYRAGGRRGGLDFGLPARPMAPSRTPPLDLGLLEQPKGPLTRGGWTLDLKKPPNRVLGGGCYKVTLVYSRPKEFRHRTKSVTLCMTRARWPARSARATRACADLMLSPKVLPDFTGPTP